MLESAEERTRHKSFERLRCWTDSNAYEVRSSVVSDIRTWAKRFVLEKHQASACVKNAEHLKECRMRVLCVFFTTACFLLAQDKSSKPGLDRENRLKDVKIACLYENITDPVRTVDETIKILKETRAELVFRAFWRWGPCPNKPEDIPNRGQRLRYALRGYYYEFLERSIRRVKKALPELLICGAVPAQIIHRGGVFNPLTGKIVRYPDTWKMALDPTKWGLKMSKKKFQCLFGKTHFWVPKGAKPEDYDPEKVPAYFPDITNPDFQGLLLAWAKRQINAGVDCIWIDMLFAQAKFLYRLSGDYNHPAVKATWRAICKIVDELHAYGRKRGRRIYVGSWATASWFPYEAPKLDFVTVSPSTQEVRTLTLNSSKWDKRLESIRKKHPKCPIFAFIDWAGSTKTPLGQFSQFLSKEQQRRFIKLADEFFTKRGVVFVYPVHGGWMGNDAEKLAFGKFRSYDSLAPEFKTYQTILLQAKKKQQTGKTPSSDKQGRKFTIPPDAVVKDHGKFIIYDFKIINDGSKERKGGQKVCVRVYRPKGKGPFPGVVIVQPGKFAS